MQKSIAKFAIKSVAVAAVLAATSLNASAALIVADPFTGTSFTDLTIGTISVLSLSDLSGSLFSFSSISSTIPFPLSFTLDAVTFTSASVGSLAGDLDPTAGGFHFANVAAGDYLVKASGTLDNSGQVHGLALVGASYTVTATPVPEPETYALMLAGLGIVGFVASRRKAG
jgi:hypothetical protein